MQMKKKRRQKEMSKAKIEIPYSFLRDLQKASATLEVMMEDCEDAQEAMNLWSIQCEIDRIIGHTTRNSDSESYAYIYERR